MVKNDDQEPKIGLKAKKGKDSMGEEKWRGDGLYRFKHKNG